MNTWINAEKEKPESGKNVLIKQEFGNRKAEFIVIGHYSEKNSIEAVGTDEYDWLDYDEDKDCYFYPEGWYEQQLNWNEFASIHINERVIEWRYLDDLRGV